MFDINPEVIQKQITDLRAELETYKVEELSRKLLAHNVARECEAILHKVVETGNTENPKSYSTVIQDYCEVPGGTKTPAHLMWMCRMVSSRQDWTSSRMHRWLGFVQGIMVAYGWSNVDHLKDIVRRCRQSHEETDLVGIA
jgi:hypothetical protein